MATASVQVVSAAQTTRQDKGGAERRCRFCFSTSLHTDWTAGDRVCTECGLVNEEHLLDDRPEWREFDDEPPTAPVRCGLVPNDETKWIGGLQPTMLSKHVSGGATQRSSSMRKTLIKCNHMMERNIEKRHAQARKEAQMDAQIRKRKRREERLLDDDDNDADIKPNFEKFVVIDEDDTALTKTAALYSEKWSLSRCLLLFGTSEEQMAVQSSDGEHQAIEGLRRNLDNVLTAASKQLYCAYTILTRTGRVLRLPESVLNDATQYLSGYAARKDSLAVRGVSSQLKRNPSKKVSTETHEQAQLALREYNCVKQYSSLSAALLFYVARRKGQLRPLADVCAAIPSDSLKTSPHLEWTRGEPLLKLKHCSRAMTEVKKLFPELAKNFAEHDGGSMTCGFAEPETSSSSRADSASVGNYVKHATQNLRLPPVTEACLQCLIQHEPGREQLRLRIASFAFFLGLVGKTMQKLASQSNHRKRRRGARTTRPASTSSSSFNKAVSQITTAITKPKEASCEMASHEEGNQEGNDTLTSLAAEERAYEMQRVWSAWKDQTSWSRSLTEISQATQVPVHQIRDYYKHRVYPQRHVLLQCLSKETAVSAPMSSVLLPHISLAAPLIKES